jgi:hypothetical protein
MNQPSRLAGRLFAIAALGLAAFARAEPSGPPAPPQEAFDACASAQKGDACTVHLGDREVKGTCESFPGKDALACRPSGPPPGPPPEAVEACAQSKAGDACTVLFKEHEVHGTCASFPGQDTLACRPDSPPGQ